MCVSLRNVPVCCLRERRVGQAAVGLGEGEIFLSQSGWSIAVRGEGVAHESWINKRFLWVIFHPVEAQEAHEIHICPKVRGLQNSNFNSVGWNNICNRAQLHFCKLVRYMRFIGFTVYIYKSMSTSVSLSMSISMFMVMFELFLSTNMFPASLVIYPKTI